MQTRYLLAGAASLALLATSALAQDHDPRNVGKAGFGRESAAANGHPIPAPTAFPPPPGTPQGPQQRPGGRPGGDHGRPGGGEQNRPGGDHGRPGWDNNNRPDDHNRPGWNGNRPGDNNRPGWDHGRPGGGWDNNRPGYRPGGRDFSNFRYYHQNMRADRRFRGPAYHRPPGWYYQRWSFGQILPSIFWGQQYWLSDFDDYDLPPPPPGTVWVRYGDDALLIDRYSGEIITVQYGVFY